MPYVFEWNATNIEHIARHGVSPPEAEYVVSHARAPYPREGVESFKVWGVTWRGRWLQVLFALAHDHAIDAGEVTEAALERFASVDVLADDETRVYVFHARGLTRVESLDAQRRMRTGR